LRIEGRIRLGYFPLPLPEAERIRKHLQLTPGFVALDPCVGEGHALAAITAGVKGHSGGIELDAYRAEQAAVRADQVVHASTFDVHCPAESISLLYLNPPYDFEISENKNERMERVSLRHTYRWLKPGGVLVLVIPCASLADCSEILAWNFKDTWVYALTEPECVKYSQVVLLVFGERGVNVSASTTMTSAANGWTITGNREHLMSFVNSILSLIVLPAFTPCPEPNRSRWPIAACRSMRSRICWRNLQPTVKQAAS